MDDCPLVKTLHELKAGGGYDQDIDVPAVKIGSGDNQHDRTIANVRVMLALINIDWARFQMTKLPNTEYTGRLLDLAGKPRAYVLCYLLGDITAITTQLANLHLDVDADVVIASLTSPAALSALVSAATGKHITYDVPELSEIIGDMPMELEKIKVEVDKLASLALAYENMFISVCKQI